MILTASKASAEVSPDIALLLQAMSSGEINSRSLDCAAGAVMLAEAVATQQRGMSAMNSDDASNSAYLWSLGATAHDGGVAFRVWAPNARSAAVVGSFNQWDADKHPMAGLRDGTWFANVPEARIGSEYKFLLKTAGGELLRIDPYAREVTNSVGNAVVHDPSFDWQGDDFRAAPKSELVIYELHVGTFNVRAGDDAPGQFADVADGLSHLQRLGVNAIQIMPVAEFAGDRSWGYNPAHIFAVEQAYGGPVALKRFIKRAHQCGIAVILDVVYNHLGPSDLDLWQFDGWSENDLGGIYFYNDARAATPWGDTRPDFGRPEVRQFICDNVMMWLGEYHFDGLRLDCTQLIRTVNGAGDDDLPDGWSLLQLIHGLIAQHCPERFTVAEDLQNSVRLVQELSDDGAGFSAQCDAAFVHPIRAAVIEVQDEQRSLVAVAQAISHCYDEDAFNRVIYSESHDEVANGKARVPQEVYPSDPAGWHAQKRSTLAAAMVLTAPGIPMLFQGQEFLQGQWFEDTVPLDWDQRDDFAGIVRLYRDLIALRQNRGGFTRGLCGQSTQMHHIDDASKIIAFHRWDQGGPADDVIVVANFSCELQQNRVIGFPAPGPWRLRFNSDWQGYSADFQGYPSSGTVADDGEFDGLACHAEVSVAPYSVLIFSQDRLGG